jgi:class 3 adenylate cyclase
MLLCAHPDVFSTRRQEVENMLTLALALKALAQGFRTADGTRLSLGIGIAAGDPFSKVLNTVTLSRKYTGARTTDF